MAEVDLDKAVQTVVAKQILEALGSDAREQLLQKAITQTLNDYGFKRGIEKAASEKAMQVAREMLDSEEWSQKFTDVVRLSLDEFLGRLPAALQKALVELFGGKKREFTESAGTIYRHLLDDK